MRSNYLNLEAYRHLCLHCLHLAPTPLSVIFDQELPIISPFLSIFSHNLLDKMATLLTRSSRPVMHSFRQLTQSRLVSTLKDHPYIYTFPDDARPGNHVLSLLSSEPPNIDLAIGTTSKLPPTPDSFTQNSKFLKILDEVVAEYAVEDPEVQSQAQVMVSTAGANLGSGGFFFAPQHNQKKRSGYGQGLNTGGDSAGGASGQGGAGSGGRGGWIHVSDSRRPPEYGRIAW